MIVRINQFEAARAESEADWASQGMLGPLLFNWPAATNAFEVLILETDEQSRPLAPAFRQGQMRQLIPHALAALRGPDEQIVVRLDGPLAANELIPIFPYLADPSGRFAISAARKLDPEPLEVIGSVRLKPSPQTCVSLCADSSLGLDRSVRLRAFSVPQDLVNPLLDADSADDERWPEILSRAGFVMGTVRGLRSLQVISRTWEAPAVKSRLVARLSAAAQNPGDWSW